MLGRRQNRATSQAQGDETQLHHINNLMHDGDQFITSLAPCQPDTLLGGSSLPITCVPLVTALSARR